MSPYHPLPARPKTHGCQLAGKRPIVLDDARKRDAGELQTRSLGEQVRLIPRSQDDHVHPVRVRLDERLTDGVRQLRFSEAVRQIAPNNHVVAQHVRLDGCAALSRSRVVENRERDPSRVMVWSPAEAVKPTALFSDT